MHEEIHPPWTRTGSIFAVVFTVVTFIFLMLSTHPAVKALRIVVPLIPVAVLIAAINAFNEEFTLRAAPLSVLVSTLGSQQALMITAIYTGWGISTACPMEC
ncbi:MAG: hypothetical protein HXS52_05720 [Theionarchaea archaeon]|nr:hypothetical protein [Theionarchaea archaeon]